MRQRLVGKGLAPTKEELKSLSKDLNTLGC